MLLSPFAKRRIALWVGLLGLAIFMGFMWYAFAGSGLVSFGGKQVIAVFDDGLNVVPRSSEVRVNGLDAGKVESIELRGSKVVVTLNVDDDVDLRQDAKARLMLKSLLGEKYVLLTPGRSKAPLSGPIRNTGMGADVSELSSGDPGSVKLYQGLGRESVFKGLNAAADLAPDTAAKVKAQLAKVREATDNLVANQAGVYDTLDDLETITDSLLAASDSLGSLLDTKKIMERRIAQAKAKAKLAFIRTDTSVQILRALVTGHEGDIEDLVNRLKAATTKGIDAFKLFQSGRYMPSALYGFGPLFDKDNRPGGGVMNPQVPAPPLPMPTEEELEKE